MALRAAGSQFAGEPHGHQSDGRAGSRPFGGNPRFSFIRQYKLQLRAEAKDEFRADAAPPFVRVTWSLRPYAQSDSFALAKESRGSGGGFLKGGTVGDSLKWRFFWYFSFATERKVQRELPVKLQFHVFPKSSSQKERVKSSFAWKSMAAE